MTIPQAAVDAAKAALLDEGCLDQEHCPGYRDAVVTTALEAAMPEMRKQIASEIRAEMPALTTRAATQTLRVCMEHAARIAEGENK